MKKQNFLFVLLALLLLGAVSCNPFTKIASEEEPGINWAEYKSYDWLSNKWVHMGNSNPEWLTPATEVKIRQAVEAQMQQRGFTTDIFAPDLVLHYHIVVKDEMTYVRDWYCSEEDWTRDGRCQYVKPVNYREGTLILDMIDGRTGNQVWRGSVSGILDNDNMRHLDKRIYQATEMMFRKFPTNMQQKSVNAERPANAK